MNSLRYFDFGTARPFIINCPYRRGLNFIIFGFPKMMGFDSTVQYIGLAAGAPMPMLAAIIAVVMEVPAAILIVLAFHRPAGGAVYFLHAGYGGDWSPLLGYDRRCG